MIIQLTLFFTASITLAIVNAIAIEHTLYWKYLWLDMPMHVLGGICAALGYAILPFFHIHLPKQFVTLTAYLVFVLLVGIGWELFEFVNDISLANATENFITDTSMDLFLDLIGGAFGYWISKRVSE
jgi:membrane associated rhomboid family serine protease